MADPTGREVDRVSVRVLPNTSRFLVDLEKFLKRVETRVRVEIPTTLDTTGLMAEAKAAVQRVERGLDAVAIDADAETAAAEAELNEVARDRTATIKVDVDKKTTDALQQALGGASKFGGGSLSGLRPNMAMVLAAAAALPTILVALELIPAALVGIAAPIGAIVAGLQGIKDAFGASGLGEALSQMRTDVSAVFAEGLTSVFNDLIFAMPTVSQGLQAIADQLVGIAEVSIGQLVSPEGLAMLGAIFANIEKSMAIIGPAMGPFTDAMLRLMKAGTEAFAGFAPVIAEVITQFSEMLTWLDDQGLLTKAFEHFFIGVAALIIVFGALVLASITVMGAFRQLLQTIGSGVGWIIDQVVGVSAQILAAVEDFPTLLTESGRQLMKGLAEGIKSGAADFVAGVVADVAADIADHFPGSPVQEGPLVSWNGGGAGKRLMDMLSGGIDARADSVKDSASKAAGLISDATLGMAEGAAAPRAGVAIQIGEVRAHDYQDFMAQTQKRAALAAMDGVRV